MKVLLIGATSSIVAATARRLAERGDQLFLVGRDPEKLQGLAEELREQVVGLVSGVDLTDRARHPGLIQGAVEALGALDLVLIGHGWLPDQVATERDPELAVACIDANLLSVISLLLPVADLMEAQRHGQIAVITSVAGMRGRPRNFTYGAAKAGLSTYLQGLRSRLYPAGVQVIDLRPGPVITPMTEGHEPNALFATPAQVASGILRAVDGGWKVRYLPWYWWPIMQIIIRVPEPVFQRFSFLVGR